jgi:hypothetical protein
MTISISQGVRVIVELADSEREELKQVLEVQLARLEEEIVRTDNRLFRDQLIARSGRLERLQQKLASVEDVVLEFS